MRVILTHDFTDDVGALAVASSRAQTRLVHAVENAAVHRLQAVADIRQRAVDDNAHGIAQVAVFHDVFDSAALYNCREWMRSDFYDAD